jgi:hypothetical protein
LTRLPRELELPEPRIWEHGTPKSVLEPLLDFWCVKDCFSTHYVLKKPNVSEAWLQRLWTAWIQLVLTVLQARWLRLARRRNTVQFFTASIPHHHHCSIRNRRLGITLTPHTLCAQALETSQRHSIAHLSLVALVIHRGTAHCRCTC